MHEETTKGRASRAQAAQAATPEAPRAAGLARPFSRYEAHPFEPPADDPDGEVCAWCGELRVQIRHHPTRVAAACRLKNLDPESLSRPGPPR